MIGFKSIKLIRVVGNLLAPTKTAATMILGTMNILTWWKYVIVRELVTLRIAYVHKT